MKIFRNLSFLIFAVTGVLSSFASEPAAEPVSLTVHPARSYQVITGFGGSIAAWGTRADDTALGLAMDDLGATIVRLNGDKDYREPPDIWTRLVKINPDVKLFISFWKPYSVEHPEREYWTFKDEYHDGKDRHRLRKERYEEWADSMVNRVKRFRDEWDMPIVALSPQNEANWRQFCYWEPEELVEFIKLLAPRMMEAGLDIKIVAPELAYLGLDAWSAKKYQPVLDLDEVDIVAYHIYDILHEKGQLLSSADTLLRHQGALGGFFREHFVEPSTGRYRKELWMTETSGAWERRMGWSEHMTEHERAIVAAQYIHAVLVEAGANVFMWWGLVYQGEPPGESPSEQEKQKFLDEGLILVSKQIRNGIQAFSERTHKYHAFKQYSKFIRPGYIRVHVDGDESLWTSAYLSPDRKQVVVVIINPGETPQPVAIDFPGTAGSTYQLDRAFATDRTRLCEEAHWPGTAEKKSVTTLIYRRNAGASSSRPPPPRGSARRVNAD